MRRFKKAGQVMTDKLGGIDDVVQDMIRSKILGVKPGMMGQSSPLPEKGPLKGVRRGLANTVFAPRGGNQYDFTSPYESNRAGVAAMLGMRALQAGAVTGAGVTLANLTTALGAQNGANQQSDTQLQM